jgi:mono/diheme cytochrome c family protein
MRNRAVLSKLTDRSIMPHFFIRRVTAAAFVLAALALAGCSLASEPIPAGPVETGPLPGEVVESAAPISQPSASDGELIYLQDCVACHGPGGAGEGEMSEQLAQQGGVLPDLSDPALARSRTPDEWFRIITDGNMAAMMPPWGGSLSDAERWDVAYYLYNFSTPPETLAEGQTLYEEQFADEYGPNGEAIGLDDPAAVSALSQSDIVDEYIADSGVDLTEDQQWAVAAYMQTFGYDPALASAASLDAPDFGGEGEPAEETPPAEEAAPDAGTEETPPEEAEPAEEPAPGTGVVRGEVVAASPDVSLPDELEINLRGVAVDENNEVFEFLSQTATVGPDDTFVFEDLPFDMDRAAYVVEAIYDGVTFSNGQIIDPASPEMDLPLTIYGNTTDPSVVTVDAMHLIISEYPDALLVTQLYVFSNASDRIYVTETPVAGGRRGSVSVAVPLDAYGLTFEDGQLGGQYIPVGDRIYDTAQMLPGTRSHAIVMNYFLPYEDARDIEIPLFFNTSQVTVLVQEGQRIRSDQLTEAGTEVIDQNAYANYIGQDLSAGDTLSLHITPGGSVGRVVPIVLLAAAGALLIGGTAYWFFQQRAAVSSSGAIGLTPQNEALVHEIARLDEAYEAGRVDRFTYETRRADLKAELAAGLENGEPE